MSQLPRAPGTNERAAPPVDRSTLRNAMRAEWTKLRTVAEAGWLLLATVILTVALSGTAAATVTYTPGAAQDPARISLTGIALGQALVAVVAVLTISAEYSTGMIHTTLAAMPRRSTVLAAKATAVGGAVIAAGLLAVLGSILAGRLLLPGSGFTPAHGYTPLSLTDAPTLRAAAGTALYLTLIALLSLGIATVVRDSATAMGIVLGLLYLFPIVTQAVDDPAWQRRLQQIAPMNAGLTLQSTVNPDTPLTPWTALAVLTGWTSASLLTATLLLRLRDA
jgi:ABC-2 type transport system permease protein